MGASAVHKDKIKKIMKFEKIMKKFCKDIGLDKRTLMTMMLGGKDIDSSATKDPSSSRKDGHHSLIASVVKESGTINTGIAA